MRQMGDLAVKAWELIEYSFFDAFIDVAIGDEFVACVLCGREDTELVSKAQSEQRGWLHSVQK